MSSKETTHIRIRVSTKERLLQIRRNLTLENKGEPVSLQDTLDRVLEEYEAWKKFEATR